MSVEAGLAAVTAFLERRGVPDEVVEYERTQSAAEEARAAHKVKHALGSRGLRLVTEQEMAERLERIEVGAVPPFGSMFHALELIDERLLSQDRILSGGDHEHSILVDPRDVIQAGEARVADICEV
jgi:prolyl-tRNA editing enzyme YbaK/EbsC (Cys-tRNA(Pro) deacylase)